MIALLNVYSYLPFIKLNLHSNKTQYTLSNRDCTTRNRWKFNKVMLQITFKIFMRTIG